MRDTVTVVCDVQNSENDEEALEPVEEVLDAIAEELNGTVENDGEVEEQPDAVGEQPHVVGEAEPVLQESQQVGTTNTRRSESPDIYNASSEDEDQRSRRVQRERTRRANTRQTTARPAPQPRSIGNANTITTASTIYENVNYVVSKKKLMHGVRWTPEEDELLMDLRAKGIGYDVISEIYITTHTAAGCAVRYSRMKRAKRIKDNQDS